ncbi:MAG TPA: plastocyanin/azurin family copper-binding protein [Nitrososphaeraceae archaeon]|nr:plastocyanin/azurin family copper-binding protein [Nitrososphaeraceae archaeon]
MFLTARSDTFVFAQGNSSFISIVPGASSPNSPIFFSPNSTRIHIGGLATWTNHDVNIHTVTSGIFNTGNTGPDPFDSGVINSGGNFTHRFTVPYTYNYYCRIHPFMTGRIIVNSLV